MTVLAAVFVWRHATPNVSPQHPRPSIRENGRIRCECPLHPGSRGFFSLLALLALETSSADRNSDDKPSLLVLILDTNPFAWSKLHPTLPLPRAVASILLFLNAHLAFSHANRVAVIAAHTKEAVFLYPSTHPSTNSETSVADDSTQSSNNDPLRDANKYRQFRIVEDEVQASFRRLMASTTPDMLAGTNETMMAGALSLALAYINRLSLASEDSASGGATGGNRTANGTRDADVTSMNARILVLSVSGDLSTQYVSMMNSIFAAQRKVSSRPLLFTLLHLFFHSILSVDGMSV